MRNSVVGTGWGWGRGLRGWRGHGAVLRERGGGWGRTAVPVQLSTLEGAWQNHVRRGLRTMADDEEEDQYPSTQDNKETMERCSTFLRFVFLLLKNGGSELEKEQLDGVAVQFEANL